MTSRSPPPGGRGTTASMPNLVSRHRELGRVARTAVWRNHTSVWAAAGSQENGKNRETMTIWDTSLNGPVGGEIGVKRVGGLGQGVTTRKKARFAESVGPLGGLYTHAGAKNKQKLTRPAGGEKAGEPVSF